MRVKLTDTALIRTFGGVIVEMQDNQANKYIRVGKAKAYDIPPMKRKYADKEIDRPEKNKMIWNPPEKKVFDPNEGEKLNSATAFPGPDDNLFPQI